MPPYPILARDEVRHVGDAIAFVVADTLDQARDAAEAIAVEWEPLPHVIGAAAALAPDAPQVWPTVATSSSRPRSAMPRPPRAPSRARRARSRSSVVNQRLVANYLDTRGVVAEYDAASDRLTLTLSSQGSHIVRDVLCNDVLKIRPTKMRVVTPDVGGGFGTKLFPYREYALAAVAAQRLKRPVKWIAERSEHFLADTHGRDNHHHGASLRSTPTAASSRSTSISSPTWAPISPPLRRSFRIIGAAMSPGRLRHSGLQRARARRLHQHRAGRCLSRRRAARRRPT